MKKGIFLFIFLFCLNSVFAQYGINPYGHGNSLWLYSGSNLYYTSGRIGIGTSSPAYLLHILTSTGGPDFGLQRSTDYLYFGIGGSPYSAYIKSLNRPLMFQTTDSGATIHPIYFYQGSSHVGGFDNLGQFYTSKSVYRNTITSSTAEGLSGADIRIGLSPTIRAVHILDSTDVNKDLGQVQQSNPGLYIWALGAAAKTVWRYDYLEFGGTPTYIRNIGAIDWRINGDISSGDAFKFYTNSSIELTGTASQSFFCINPKINKSSGSYAGLCMDVTETAISSSDINYLAYFSVGSSKKFAIRNTGAIEKAVNVSDVWVQYSNQGSGVALCTLPANAFVLGITLWVYEAFNSDGTDVIEVGYSGNTNAYSTQENIESTGVKTVTLGASSLIVDTTSRAVQVLYSTDDATNLTTGKAHVTISWTIATTIP